MSNSTTSASTSPIRVPSTATKPASIEKLRPIGRHPKPSARSVPIWRRRSRTARTITTASPAIPTISPSARYPWKSWKISRVIVKASSMSDRIDDASTPLRRNRAWRLAANDSGSTPRSRATNARLRTRRSPKSVRAPLAP